MNTAEILDVPLSCVAEEELLSAMDAGISRRELGQYISITNTESVYHAVRIPQHKRFIRGARFSLCDGVGVVVAGWFWGHRISRLNGPTLQLACCKFGQERGWRHFFYGGKEGVAERLVENLIKHSPKMLCAGAYSPPFRELTAEEDAAVTKIIRDARPDIVWVGLGLLKQEKWISEHLDRIQAPWMIGVGAAFDYHSGEVPWAPAWMRSAGLEWLFRLIIQPRLRAKRYWWSLLVVVEATVKGLIRSRDR